jgi:hypothetical protein
MRLAPFIMAVHQISFSASDAGTHAHYNSDLREYHPIRIRFQIMLLLHTKHSRTFFV